MSAKIWFSPSSPSHYFDQSFDATLQKPLMWQRSSFKHDSLVCGNYKDDNSDGNDYKERIWWQWLAAMTLIVLTMLMARLTTVMVILICYSTRDGHVQLLFRSAYPHIGAFSRIFPHPHGHPSNLRALTSMVTFCRQINQWAKMGGVHSF